MFLRSSLSHGIAALFCVLVAACVGCRPETRLTEVQRVKSGAIDIVLLSRDGVLHQKDSFTIEFRSSAGGNLLDAGAVRANVSMPMPGMPMLGSIEIRPTKTAGRYNANTNLDMAGGWRIALEWDGPAGRGAVNFAGTVQ